MRSPDACISNGKVPFCDMLSCGTARRRYVKKKVSISRKRKRCARLSPLNAIQKRICYEGFGRRLQTPYGTASERHILLQLFLDAFHYLQCTALARVHTLLARWLDDSEVYLPHLNVQTNQFTSYHTKSLYSAHSVVYSCH